MTDWKEVHEYCEGCKLFKKEWFNPDGYCNQGYDGLLASHMELREKCPGRE
jgi:hypothetical protein